MKQELARKKMWFRMSCFLDIENEIGKACDLGKFDTSYWLNVEYKFTANKIINKLRDRGFEVDQSDTDFRQIYIYWRKDEWD